MKKPKLVPLSDEARKLRMPLNPADLLDALQDPVHRDVGRSKPAAKTTKRQIPPS